MAGSPGSCVAPDGTLGQVVESGQARRAGGWLLPLPQGEGEKISVESSQLTGEITGKIVVGALEVAEVAGAGQRRLHAAEHRFDPAPVLDVYRIEQRLQGCEMLGPFRIVN